MLVIRQSCVSSIQPADNAWYSIIYIQDISAQSEAFDHYLPPIRPSLKIQITLVSEVNRKVCKSKWRNHKSLQIPFPHQSRRKWERGIKKSFQFQQKEFASAPHYLSHHQHHQYHHQHIDHDCDHQNCIKKDTTTSLQTSLRIPDQKKQPNCTSVYRRWSYPLRDYKPNQIYWTSEPDLFLPAHSYYDSLVHDLSNHFNSLIRLINNLTVFTCFLRILFVTPSHFDNLLRGLEYLGWLNLRKWVI